MATVTGEVLRSLFDKALPYEFKQRMASGPVGRNGNLALIKDMSVDSSEYPLAPDHTACPSWRTGMDYGRRHSTRWVLCCFFRLPFRRDDESPDVLIISALLNW